MDNAKQTYLLFYLGSLNSPGFSTENPTSWENQEVDHPILNCKFKTSDTSCNQIPGHLKFND